MATPLQDRDKLARELLAAEYEAAGHLDLARALRRAELHPVFDVCALRAILTALTHPREDAPKKLHVADKRIEPAPTTAALTYPSAHPREEMGEETLFAIRAGLDLASKLACDVPITAAARRELRAAFDALDTLVASPSSPPEDEEARNAAKLNSSGLDYRLVSAPPPEDANAPKCRHEPRDGHCIHCGVPFKDGQPNYGDYPASSLRVSIADETREQVAREIESWKPDASFDDSQLGAAQVSAIIANCANIARRGPDFPGIAALSSTPTMPDRGYASEARGFAAWDAPRPTPTPIDGEDK